MSGMENDTVATIEHQEIHVDCVNSGFELDEGDEGEKPQHSPNAVKYNPASPTVAISQPGVPVIAQKPDPNRKPKDFVIFSCFIIMGCNFIFGLIAYNYGVKSSYAWQLGEENQARKRSKWALLFCIIGLIVGILTWVLVFTLYFTIGDKTHSVVP
ncbi:hypothetical protein SNE40_015009 [Patella caerulea]|uniref:Interferon-induced transmembrane protein n=1 Tax=Patella caerulea TaxID=87958 RepID=A0AAN8PIC7_PATCE